MATRNAHRTPREFPEFPAALAFTAWLSPEDVARALALRAETLRARMASAEEAPQLPRVLVLKDEYMRAITRAELDWIQSTVTELESGTLTWDTQAQLREAQLEHATETWTGGPPPTASH